MIYAIVGTVHDDDGAGSIRGNGKTLAMVYFGYQGYKKEGQRVYANFKISFGETLSINTMLDLFKSDQLQDTVIMLDESQLYIPSTGVKAGVIQELVHTLAAQSRKRGIDIMLTTQRYKSIHRALRAQVDEILVPKKIHLDGTVCMKDRCDEKHTIQIWKYPNLYGDPLVVLNPEAVGRLYDSNEIVLDRLVIDDPKKKARLEKVDHRALREEELVNLLNEGTIRDAVSRVT